jgi:hypothetical protein
MITAGLCPRSSGFVPRSVRVRFMVDMVSVGQVYGGHGVSWTGLWWTWCQLDRFMVDMMSVGQGYGGHGVSWTVLWWT